MFGSNALYTYQYSASMAVAFGRGPCNEILSVWAEGKRMYSAKQGNATIVGSVEIVAGDGKSGDPQPVQQGMMGLPLKTGDGAFLYIQAGTVILLPGGTVGGAGAGGGTPDNDYEVQQDITLGPDQLGTLFVWPPLQVTFTQNVVITMASIPGNACPTVDSSDFTVDPSYGHIESDGPRIGGTMPKGGMQVYVGTDDQMPDPNMSDWLGTGNVPGYRGLIYIVINNLQLINFGNHIPRFTAEIAFDGTNDVYPIPGPVPNALATAAILLAEEMSSLGPPTPGPFVYAINNGNAPSAISYDIAEIEMADAPQSIDNISESGGGRHGSRSRTR